VRHRSNIAEDILRIWREIVGRDDIGPDDNFLDVDGSSVLVLEFSSQLKARLGYDLSISDIARQPTARGIELLLRNGITASDHALMPLQPLGSKAPLYCVHAVGGSALTYFPLARALGYDQPLLAFQAPALSGKTDPTDDTGAMASLYTAEILQRQPAGPFYMVGFCFGGIVALEMAYKLSRITNSESAVILLDSSSAYEGSDAESRPYKTLTEYVLRIDFDVSELKHISHTRALAAIRTAAIAQGRFAGDVTVEQLATIYDVVAAHCRAAISYRPRSYSFPCLLVRGNAESEIGRDLGWSPYISALTVEELPVNHVQLVDPEGAALLCEPISNFLASALTRDRP
jgi:thioesterase domain-containing protein